jgi:hypothetical protein
MPFWQPQHFPDEPPNREGLMAEARVFAARFRAPSPRLVRPQIATRSAALRQVATRRTSAYEDQHRSSWRIAA